MLIMNRSPLAQMRDEVSQLFSTFFADLPAQASRAAAPPMNVWEQGESYFVEAELPGFSMNDVEVSVVGSEVTIQGRSSQPEAEGTYMRRERGAGEFTRTWTLPAEIDAERVEASLKDGVLLVKLPKSPKALPRKIQVKPA